VITDADLSNAARLLAQAIRTRSGVTAMTRNADGEHTVLVKTGDKTAEITVQEGLVSGHIDRRGSGRVQAVVRAGHGRNTFTRNADGAWELAPILDYILK
jgi:hypothetical protein